MQGRSGCQYGPRIYPDKELQDVVGLAYVNRTVYTTPGNELNLIKKTQRTNETPFISGIIEGCDPIQAMDLTPRI